MALNNIMQKKLSAQWLSSVFLLLSLLFVPVNYDLSGLRFSDFLVVFSFLSLMVSRKVVISKGVLFCFFSFFVVVFFSVLVSVFNHSEIAFERVIFLYKYLVIFVVILLSYYHFSSSYGFASSFSKVIFFVHLLLTLWVFVYQYLVISGVIHGSFRPSFPFSRDYEASDAHLYSALLGFLLLFYLLHLGEFLRHSIFTRFVLGILFFIALVFTGSRGGIILLAVGVAIFVFIKTSLQRKLLLRIAFLAPVLLFLLNFAVYLLQALYLPDTDYNLVTRAFNFDFSNDQSSISRIQKFEMALSDLDQKGVLLGAGFLYASLDWYDGFLSILLAHGGFLALCVFILSSSLLLIKISYFSAENFALMAALFLSYVFINFVTEYVLVFRNMMPSVMVLTYCFYLGVLSKSRRVWLG